MSPVLADVLLVTALIGALAMVHRPLGDYGWTGARRLTTTDRPVSPRLRGVAVRRGQGPRHQGDDLAGRLVQHQMTRVVHDVQPGAEVPPGGRSEALGWQEDVMATRGHKARRRPAFGQQLRRQRGRGDCCGSSGRPALRRRYDQPRATPSVRTTRK